MAWFIGILFISIFWVGGRGYFHFTNGMIPLSIFSGIVIYDFLVYLGIDIKLFAFFLTCFLTIIIIFIYKSKVINDFLKEKIKTYIITDDLIDVFKQIDKINNDRYVLPIPQRTDFNVVLH